MFGCGWLKGGLVWMSPSGRKTLKQSAASQAFECIKACKSLECLWHLVKLLLGTGAYHPKELLPPLSRSIYPRNALRWRQSVATMAEGGFRYFQNVENARNPFAAAPADRELILRYTRAASTWPWHRFFLAKFSLYGPHLKTLINIAFLYFWPNAPYTQQSWMATTTFRVGAGFSADKVGVPEHDGHNAFSIPGRAQRGASEKAATDAGAGQTSTNLITLSPLKTVELSMTNRICLINSHLDRRWGTCWSSWGRTPTTLRRPTESVCILEKFARNIQNYCFFGILNLGFDHVQDLARAKKVSLEPQDEDMGKALRGNVDPNHWQERILNGQIYHAFPVCSLPLQFEDSGKAWFFEGCWQRGT